MNGTIISVPESGHFERGRSIHASVDVTIFSGFPNLWIHDEKTDQAKHLRNALLLQQNAQLFVSVAFLWTRIDLESSLGHSNRLTRHYMELVGQIS